ncbi:MAG: hypothetical protein HHJ19_14570 [Polaromonas sp.]|nr:hypothetical protein [Polaromonas sp.]
MGWKMLKRQIELEIGNAVEVDGYSQRTLFRIATERGLICQRLKRCRGPNCAACWNKRLTSLTCRFGSIALRRRPSTPSSGRSSRHKQST